MNLVDDHDGELSNVNEARSAIESLRIGVPNADAIRATGWRQQKHTDRFDELLAKLETTTESPTMGIVDGEFGSGKSHLLGFLAQRAKARNFVVSTVVVSAETKLGDLKQVLNAALDSADGNNVRGSLFDSLIANFQVDSHEARDLVEWVNGAPGMLQACLNLALAGQQIGQKAGPPADPEFVHDVERWLRGETLGISRVKAELRENGWHGHFIVSAIKIADRLPYAFELYSRLIKAAGYSGWVIMFDELELIGRLPKASRAKAYAAVGDWLGPTGDRPPFIGTVGMNIETFVADVLERHGDNDGVLEDQIRNRGGDANESLADRIANGIDLLEDADDRMLITRPGKVDREATFASIKAMYEKSYGAQVPNASDDLLHGLPPETPMRIYVKRWVNWMDGVRLKMIDAESNVEDDISRFAVDFSEDKDLDADESDD